MTWARTGLTLRAYLLATRAIPIIAKPFLRRRLAKGKEDPKRWQEKLGRPTLERPTGRLIWLHAVGLGETLALRGLIAQLHAQDPLLHFLITSTTSKSAEAIAKHLPPNTQHQFLPLDAPAYINRFLNHWKPNLAVWTEQDLWPGFAVACTKREIPQAIVAGRMHAASFASRTRLSGLYRNLYQRMAMIAVQDKASGQNITALGGANVAIKGSLKPAAPPLDCDYDELARLQAALKDRFVWAVAPSHLADEDIAISAHNTLCAVLPDALLLIIPRFPDREIAVDPKALRRSSGVVPHRKDRVWIIDSFGETGLFYRLARAAYIGGTNDDTEGHSPWEAIALNTPVFHGPRTQNFTADFFQLNEHGLSHLSTRPDELAAALNELRKNPQPETTLVLQVEQQRVAALAHDLCNLIEPSHD